MTKCKMILLLSGPAAAGKSTICKHLIDENGFSPIKSSGYLRSLAKLQERDVTRELLQEIGDRLDVETNFTWLVEDVAVPQIEECCEQHLWLVDSVRKHEQIERFEKAFPEKVFHCHITAPDEVLEMRLSKRCASYERGFAEHVSHPNEVSARYLGRLAAIVVDTSKVDALSACVTIMEEVRVLCKER